VQFRSLGSSGLEISVIGLGTWAIGGGDWQFGWGDQDESDAIAAINRSVELGINWIDTAAIYGEGRSEELIGRALSQMPAGERPLIATKCGRVAVGNGQIDKSLKRDSVIQECDASLRRLGVECIDLYQMHWPEPDEDIEEGWQTLVDLQQQGKVRHIGVSNHNVEQLKRLQKIAPVASLQPPYSMIAREVESDILPWCGQNGIGVICYSPMGKGMLTGKFTAARAASLSANDHRSRDPRFQAPQLEVNLAFVRSLQTIADGLGWSLPELAIAWVLHHDAVTSAIVGARSAQQITETAVAGDRSLSTAANADIAAAIADRDKALTDLGDVTQARV
jgi:aryl-alcohol dehydrogenase-like predicted oxidoreductase